MEHLENFSDAKLQMIHNVAPYQKWTMVAIPLFVIGNALGLASLLAPDLPFSIHVLLLSYKVPIFLFAAFAVFKQASTLYQAVVGILCAVLVAPCVWPFVFLILNRRATAFLRQRRLKVELNGVDLSEVESLQQRRFSGQKDSD